jgi:hypothetical protein
MITRPTSDGIWLPFTGIPVACGPSSIPDLNPIFSSFFRQDKLLTDLINSASGQPQKLVLIAVCTVRKILSR